MVQLSTAFIGLVAVVATSIHAAPIVIEKRIAQVIADSTAKWEQACLSAGGAEKCNPISITAFTTLLAAAGPCEQQDAADSMVALSKSLGSSQMLALSQIFVQQPRNSPNSVAIPYCQKAPQNAELNGLFQCQFAGSNQQTFAGGATLGQPGTIPFGLNAPLNPPGSCPANPNGPIADGTQLTDITSNPGVASSGDSGAEAPPPPAKTAANTNVEAPPATTAAPAPATSAAPPAATTAASDSGSTGFALANGKDAQALNKKFATLNADSACSAGDTACIDGGFAQCVGGKFVNSGCSSGLTCVALPLVNKRGTSLTCDTTADAEARIASTGATGGLTGDGAAADQAPSAPTPTAEPDAQTEVAKPQPTKTASEVSTGASGSFLLANGKDAQALNKKFASLSATSSCSEGDEACVDGGFAQCVGGKFVNSGCASGLTCVALPLVNKRGTSVTCDTNEDALARIASTGATGGLTGA